MGILQADHRFSGNPRISLLVGLKTLSKNFKKAQKKTNHFYLTEYGR